MSIKIKLNNSHFTKEFLKTYSRLFPDLNDKLNIYIPDINTLMETGILSDKLEALLNSNKIEDRSLAMFTMPLRFEYVKLYGFNLLSDKFLKSCKEILKDEKILEVGAGSGFFTMKLKELSLDIVGLEKHQTKNHYGFNHQYTKLINSDAIEFIKQHELDYSTIIMSWPNQDSSFANDVFNSMYKGQKLLYIGEGLGGCTACDEFFENLDRKASIEVKETQELRKNYVSWQGIHDRPTLYIKK